MIRRIKILSSPEAVLAIGRTKKSLRRDVLWLALALLLAAGCLVMEFVVLLREPTPDYLSLGAVGLGAVVLALLSGLLRRLRQQLLVRDRVVFDRAQAVVRLNDAPFCRFDELQRVVLEAVHDTEDHFRGYQLYLTTPAKGRLVIGEGLATPKDLAVGQAIAAFTGKPLERRGEQPADAFCQP
jgi:hypothetical protein